MEKLSRKFEDEYNSVFVYVREAHPGEKFPAHESIDQKLSHARSFKEKFDISRPVLVDSLDGSLHRAFGELPNMTYIVGTSGKVLFRSNWTDAHTIGHAMEYILHGYQQKKEVDRMTSFYSELLGHREINREAFLNGLLENGGKRSVDEFIDRVEQKHGERMAEKLRALRKEPKGE